MSAARARFEASRARYYRLPLPPGHPYAVLPAWTPYVIARLFGALHARFPVREGGRRRSFGIRRRMAKLVGAARRLYARSRKLGPRSRA